MELAWGPCHYSLVRQSQCSIFWLHEEVWTSTCVRRNGISRSDQSTFCMVCSYGIVSFPGLDKKHSEPGYAQEDPTVYSNGHTALQMGIIPRDMPSDREVLSNPVAPKREEAQFDKSGHQQASLSTEVVG